MTTYVICALNSLNSPREWVVKQFSSLRQAKTYASKTQGFYYTTLVIYTHIDRRLVAYKDTSKSTKWTTY